MTPLEAFQKRYGPEYQKIVSSVPFQAGLQFLNMRKIEEICALSNKDIQDNAHQILGGIQAHFKHETDLLNLHNLKEFKIAEEPGIEYISPEEEAERQAKGKRKK